MTKTKLSQEEWEKLLEEMVEKDNYEIVKNAPDVMTAMLKKDGDYWRFNEKGKLIVLSEDAVNTIQKPEEVKQEKQAKLGGTKESSSYPVPMPERGLPAAVSKVITEYAKSKNIDPNDVILQGGKPYIMHGGLLELGHRKGIRAITIESVTDIEPIEADEKEWKGIKGKMVVSHVYAPFSKDEMEIIKMAANLAPEVQKDLLAGLFKPFVGIGTATPNNVKVKSLLNYLNEIVCTRSINRALRLYTGFGDTSAEELSDYEGEVE